MGAIDRKLIGFYISRVTAILVCHVKVWSDDLLDVLTPIFDLNFLFNFLVGLARDSGVAINIYSNSTCTLYV